MEAHKDNKNLALYQRYSATTLFKSSKILSFLFHPDYPKHYNPIELWPSSLNWKHNNNHLNGQIFHLKSPSSTRPPWTSDIKLTLQYKNMTSNLSPTFSQITQQWGERQHLGLPTFIQGDYFHSLVWVFSITKDYSSPLLFVLINCCFLWRKKKSVYVICNMFLKSYLKKRTKTNQRLF